MTTEPTRELSGSIQSRVAIDEIPFQGIVEQALAGVYVVYDECFRYVNETFAAMFGYRIDEMEGMHMRDLVTLDSGDDVMLKYEQRILGETHSIRYTTKCRHKDGHIVHLEIHGARVLFRGKPALSGMAVDITDRIESQRELALSRERMRELVHHIDAVREDQRAALARDVHDVLGGMLSSIKMDVTRIIRRSEPVNLREIRDIGLDLLELTQETIDAARAISDELRPRVLDSLGLAAALEELVKKFGARSGITASFVSSCTQHSWPANTSIECFRIVQEALTNVGRHSGARRVYLRISAQEDEFEVAVEDDGCGIASRPTGHAGFGILSMTERARRIGATLVMAPMPLGGTSIVVRGTFVTAGDSP